MTALFHLTQNRLGAGSVIEPGNFGRLLRRYQHRPAQPNGQVFGSSWLLARELLFEVVRLEAFPHKPSRWRATFMLETVDAAERYRHQHDQLGLQVLHQVEIADEGMPIHRGALGLIVPPVELDFYDGTRALAERYWQGDEVGDWEVVTASSLRVVGQVDAL